MSEYTTGGKNGSGSKPRARDLGIDIGIFSPGPANAITDVKGVLVGHETIVKGEGALIPGEGPVRTGVTVILPHGGNLFRDKVLAGCHVLNGFGKSTGFHQIRELGTLETPIALTNTLNVGIVADALIEWSCRGSPEIGIGTGTVNPVVGDINDGYLNDIQGRHVKREHVFAALEAAQASGRAGSATPDAEGSPDTSGAPAEPAAPAVPVVEGNVGAGTGCSCLGFKGGIGTSSRLLPARLGGWTVGVLVQSNFGGILSVNGAPIGRELGVFDFAPRGATSAGSDLAADFAGASALAASPADPGAIALDDAHKADPGARDGSCMIVIATDAPLDSRQLTRIARRAGLGLARCGFYSSSGSGDFFIAFSTAGQVPHSLPPGTAAAPLLSRSIVPDDAMSAIFAASVEAVEEAVVNSLVAAETMTGRDGNARRALDAERFLPILDKYNARFWSTRLPPRGAL